MHVHPHAEKDALHSAEVTFARLIRAGLLSGMLAVGCSDRERAPEPETRAEPPVDIAMATAEPRATGAQKPPPALERDAERQRLVVVAGGDVSFGRRCGQRILKDPSYNPLAGLTSILRHADLRLVNLESPLSDQGGETQSPRNRLIFTGPPGGAEVLSRAGIDVVNVANNHAWDYGKPAFVETLAHLRQAGVGVVGGSETEGTQYKPLVVHVKGFSIAIFGATQIWNQGPFRAHSGRHYVAWARFDKLGREIVRARLKYDLVFVNYHGGGEYIDIPMQRTRHFVKQVMQAKVDALFGHHPHVVQGVRWFGERPAFYSLGNLVFNLNERYPWTGIGALARLTFARDAPTRVEICPYRIEGHRPEPLLGDEAQALRSAFRERFEEVSRRVGGTRMAATGRDGCIELAPP